MRGEETLFVILVFLAVFVLAVLVLAQAKDWWLAARKAKYLTRDPALFADMNAEERRQRLQVMQAPAAAGLTSERKKVTHG